MILQRGNLRVDDDGAEIFDVHVDWVQQEKILEPVLVHRIEDCRHVRDQREKNIIKVTDIPEKYEQSRENHSDADVENKEAGNRIDQKEHSRPEVDIVHDAEDEKHNEREPEIHECRDILRQREHIFGHIDLREDLRIVDKRAHSVLRGFLVVRKDYVARKKINGVMINVLCEELCEDDLHDQQREER